MNLLHLRYFVELAGTQHYTRAAEALCITQPTLSHAISQLEFELGLPLFEKQEETSASPTTGSSSWNMPGRPLTPSMRAWI